MTIPEVQNSKLNVAKLEKIINDSDLEILNNKNH